MQHRALSKDKQWFYFEKTDTFHGEANYCWVKRFKVKAKTRLAAVRIFSKHNGYQNRLVGRERMTYADGCATYDVQGAHIVVFVNWDGGAEYLEKHWTYLELT